ncbi:hypothetical protein Sarmat_00711 [Rickettsiales endosymbiont of Paramecium tredecaurelia]|nr:hypothetical protein [Candidatus Sarmatiella mevalonica]
MAAKYTQNELCDCVVVKRLIFKKPICSLGFRTMLSVTPVPRAIFLALTKKFSIRLIIILTKHSILDSFQERFHVSA